MNHLVRFGIGFADSARRAGASYKVIDSALERAYETLHQNVRGLACGQSVTVPVLVFVRPSGEQVVIRCQVWGSLVEAEEVMVVAEEESGIEREKKNRLAQLMHRKWDMELVELAMTG